MSIRHGSIVEISLDSSSARTSSLKARVYDVIGKRFILSQTSPPLRPAHVGKPIRISYISKAGTPPRRLAFQAKLSDLSNNYMLSSGVFVPAMIVEMQSEPKQISLRKGYRVHPTQGSGISLSIGGRECEIVDISLAGVRFVHGFALDAFRPADQIKCLLSVDSRPYPVEAKVIRVSQVSLTRHVAAAFPSLSNELQTILSKKILWLERKQLSRGL